MAITKEGWYWEFDRWLVEKGKENIVEPAADKVGETVGGVFKSIGLSAWEWFVEVLPDLIGYGAVATGVFVILSTMAGRGMIKPLAIFSGVTIVAVSILGAT